MKHVLKSNELPTPPPLKYKYMTNKIKPWKQKRKGLVLWKTERTHESTNFGQTLKTIHCIMHMHQAMLMSSYQLKTSCKTPIYKNHAFT